MTEHGLGRLHRPDARDAAYPMATVLGPKWTFKANAKPKLWQIGPVLDQGQTPKCVGYATAGWAEARPYPSKLSTRFNGDIIYADCKKIDGAPNEDGSDAHAAMKVMVADGKLTSYYWATTPEEFAGWLATRTPVLCGTNWHEAMFNPDVGGFVRPTGAIAGGHEYLACGFVTADTLLDSTVKFVNSWGTSWGEGGTFYMVMRDLWKLMSDGGDAVAGLQKRV